MWVKTVEQGHLEDRRTEKKSTCVREVLPEGEGWIKEGGSVWTGIAKDFSAMATPLEDVGGRSQRDQGVRGIDR